MNPDYYSKDVSNVTRLINVLKIVLHENGVLTLQVSFFVLFSWPSALALSITMGFPLSPMLDRRSDAVLEFFRF